jgi:hypothetical protein
MDGAQVGVLKKSNEISLSSLLKSKHGTALESEVSLVVLSDLTNKSLEWKFADEELSALLVLSDFTEGDGSWAIAVWLLDTTGARRALLSCLGGKMLLWLLSCWSFACGMLCSCHLKFTEGFFASDYIVRKVSLFTRNLESDWLIFIFPGF